MLLQMIILINNSPKYLSLCLPAHSLGIETGQYRDFHRINRNCSSNIVESENLVLLTSKYCERQNIVNFAKNIVTSKSFWTNTFYFIICQRITFLY